MSEMNGGRHSGQSGRTGFSQAALLTAVVSFTTGMILVIPAVAELLRYSPYEDPGAGVTGLRLGAAAAVLVILPVVALVIAGIVSVLRRYARWRRSLTPGQRMALGAAEMAAGLAVHEAWKHHNEAESARLTESVMGPDRGADTGE